MFSSLLALEAKKVLDEDGNPVEKTYITYQEATEWLKEHDFGEKEVLQELKNVVIGYLAITVAKVQKGAPAEYEEMQSLDVEAALKAVDLLNAIHSTERFQNEIGQNHEGLARGKDEVGVRPLDNL